MARKKLGELLREAGLIDEMQLAAALGMQRQWGGRLGRTLVQMGVVNEEEITDAVSRQLALPTVRLEGCTIDPAVLALVPAETCEKHQLIPFEITRDSRGVETLHVAMSDPTNLMVIDELAFGTGRRIAVAVTSDRELNLAIRHHFYGEAWPIYGDPTPIPGAMFAGPELELQAADEPLEVADEARQRVERSLVAELPAAGAKEIRPPERTPTQPHLVYGGPGQVSPPGPTHLPASSSHPPARQAGIPATPPKQAEGPRPTGRLSMEERLLLQTMAAELAVEEIDDRQLLLALARLLIRKGVITEGEWIAELARR